MSDEEAKKTPAVEEVKDAAPKDTAPKDAAPKDAAPKDAAPKDAAPKDAAPKDAAPKDAAPKDAAPKDAAPKDAASVKAGGDQDGEKRVDPQELKDAKKVKKAKAQQKAGVKQKGGKGKKGKKGKKAIAPFVKRTQAPRLKQKYNDEIIPLLMKEFNYSTVMAAPKLVKITLNMGLGEALQNAKLLDAAVLELETITGQKPVITKARKSIATFKLRQGQKIGCMVTLRRDRMFEFYDRLVSFALPRTRDFKGLSPKSFDGRGNFSMGVREQIIFPEIDYDKIEKIMGLNISIVTSAKTDEEGHALLKHLGMPFRQ